MDYFFSVASFNCLHLSLNDSLSEVIYWSWKEQVPRSFFLKLGDLFLLLLNSKQGEAYSIFLLWCLAQLFQTRVVWVVRCAGSAVASALEDIALQCTHKRTALVSTWSTGRRLWSGYLWLGVEVAYYILPWALSGNFRLPRFAVALLCGDLTCRLLSRWA